MIKKKYLKKIAVVAATAALLFQVQPAIAADIFEDGETTAATEEIQEPEAVPMVAAEENAEAAVEESGAEGTSDQETEVPAENAEAEELQPETPEYKTDFQFENSEVKITATATKEAKLPQNTEMRAVRLEEGTAAYEKAKAASAQTQNIVHIEDTEAGRQVQDVTSVSGDGSNLQSVDFAM